MATRRRGPTKGDQREQAILTAAATIFASKPIASVTIDELASGAGISRSSFYFYFKSKEAVLAALLDHVADGLRVSHAAWLQSNGRDDEALRVAVTQLATMWRKDGALFDQARAAVSDYPSVAEFAEAGAKRFAKALGEKITRDRAAGLMPDGIAPEDLARMVDGARLARLRQLSGRKDSRHDVAAIDDVVTITNVMLYGTVSD